MKVIFILGLVVCIFVLVWELARTIRNGCDPAWWYKQLGGRGEYHESDYFRKLKETDRRQLNNENHS